MMAESSSISYWFHLCNTVKSFWTSNLSNILILNMINVASFLAMMKCLVEYASVNWVSIGSDNGLSPIRRQAII